MSTGEISDAIRSLTEEVKGDVLFLTDKFDKKTVVDVLHETSRRPCKAIMSYQVGKDSPKNLPYHQSISEKLNASMDRKFVINMHGSYGPSGLDDNKGQRLLIRPRIRRPRINYANR